jgi:hypothetical protein
MNAGDHIVWLDSDPKFEVEGDVVTMVIRSGRHSEKFAMSRARFTSTEWQARRLLREIYSGEDGIVPASSLKRARKQKERGR